MNVIFNEFDPFAANWLVKLFPDATIDDRNIFDVEPQEVVGFTRAHFFGGIGGWELALRLAGWPDERKVWTGSCPCQPFSCAGKGKGESDKRHLWPQFRRLIAECRPPVVFGEQVASKLGRKWFAGVRADLEVLGYAVGAAGLPAACVGSPHPRHRIFWVADSGAAERGCRTESGDRPGESFHAADGSRAGRMADAAGPSGPEQRRGPGEGLRRQPAAQDAAECSRFGGLAIPANGRCEDGGGRCRCEETARSGRPDVARCGGADRLADTEHDGGRIDESQRGPLRRTAYGGLGPRMQDFETFDGFWEHLCGIDPSVRMGDSASRGLGIDGTTSGDGGHADEPSAIDRLAHADAARWERRVCEPYARRIGSDRHIATGHSQFWSTFDLVFCRDGKVRRIEPGTFPLADGVPNRVGRLRGYGNAIVPQVAAQFITAFLQVLKG